MSQLAGFLRLERRPILAWAAGIGTFLALMGLVYSSFDGEALNELIENYPESILEAIGTADLGTVQGFLKAEMGIMVPLALGLLIAFQVSKHLAGAEESGRLDHALARPLSRAQYFWSLMAASSTGLVAILIASGLLGMLGFLAQEPREILGVLGFMMDMIPFALFFVGLSGLLGAAFHRRSLAVGSAAGLLVAFFVMGLTARLVDGAQSLRWFTPFSYLERSSLGLGELDALYYVVCCLVGGALAWLGAWQFGRKDLFA